MVIPTAEKNSENAQSPERDRPKDSGGDKERHSKSKPSTKAAKDLSHVPCKFFKVGSCTAGPSCPFSHHEPGQQKDVCAWFVKGNCKFGHKCALAHILPGQSMAMDKKNKKAAQIAAGASAGSGRDGAKGVRAQKRDHTTSNSLDVNHRNPLFSGSTAPTRILPASARPPLTMPLKASISPSAPAPTLKDTDFTTIDLLDEDDTLSTPPAQRKFSTPPPSAQPSMSAEPSTTQESDIIQSKSPPPLPASTPRRAAVPSHRASNSVDFGPIGSPPRVSPQHTSRMNGFSPGTSPIQGAGLTSTSPFSAPGAPSMFLSYERSDDTSDFKTRSGIAMSLGANRNWNPDPNTVPSRVKAGLDTKVLGSMALGGEVAAGEEDLEEFIPSSLTDLLTPEEKSRRMSRTNSGQGPAANPVTITPIHDSSSGLRLNVEGGHHRYSRSVPAPSLLSEIRSIWADNENGFLGPGDGMGNGLGLNTAVAMGTPRSFKSSSVLGGPSFGEDVLNPSLLAPSNASAAFLPGLHHHYHSSKSANLGALSGPQSLYPTMGPGPNMTTTMPPNALTTPKPNAMALPPPRPNALSGAGPYNGPQDSHFVTGPFTRAMLRAGNGLNAEVEDNKHAHAISPSTRALQSHAPGQSLPQGLAAGYSRVHALPPLPSVPSPNVSTPFSTGLGAHISGSNGHEWMGTSNALEYPSVPHGVGVSTGAGLDGMMSRLSFSAAPPRGPQTLSSGASGQPQAMGMSRNPSGSRWPSQGGPRSPLSRPVADDDDLFSMDG